MMSLLKNSIGIFGGSFNPVHLAHVALADEVQKRCAFKTLYIVPSQNPPHKPPYEIDPHHRLEMVRIAFKDVPGASISTFEIDRKQTSYGVHTIDFFKKQHPESEIFFILGQDAFFDLPKWFGFPEVLSACSYLVVTRQGWDPLEDTYSPKMEGLLDDLIQSNLLKERDKDPGQFERSYKTTHGASRICFLKLKLPEVSSTETRMRMQFGESLSGLVPQGVEAYLKTSGLCGK